jgi:hypothetical protein
MTAMVRISRDDALAVARWQYADLRKQQKAGNPFCRMLLTEDAWCQIRANEIMRIGATDTERAYLIRNRASAQNNS